MEILAWDFWNWIQRTSISLSFLMMEAVRFGRRQWLPTPVFLPGESHGQQSLVSYSPCGHKESDRIEWLTHTQSDLDLGAAGGPWFALLWRKFGLNEKQVGSTKIEVETEGGCEGPDSIPSHSTLVVADAQLHLWPRTVLFFSFSWIPNATKFLCFASVSLSVWDLQSK